LARPGWWRGCGFTTVSGGDNHVGSGSITVTARRVSGGGSRAGEEKGRRCWYRVGVTSPIKSS
jgi:hypothetical protein